MAKKTNGDGSYRKTSNGNWNGRIMLGKKPNGEAKVVSVTRKTQKEAKLELLRLKREYETSLEVKEEIITLSSWITKWLDLRRNSLRYKTVESYESAAKCVENHRIGNADINHIKLIDIQGFLNSIIGKEVNRRIPGLRKAELVKLVINCALEYAVENDILDRNPAKKIKLPKKPQNEIVPMNKQEIRKFISACDTEKYGLCYYFMIGYGLRLGEAVGLKWSDVDFHKRVFSINRTIGIKRGAGLAITEPKTHKSKRSLPITQELYDRLKAQQAKQDSLIHKLDGYYQDEGYINTQDNGKVVHPGSLYKIYKRILRVNGISEKRVHDLRHTFASMVIERGDNPKVLQELLGHSTINMSMHYSHISENAKTRAIENLNESLKGIAVREKPLLYAA
ncbi:MAG: site-specific integrase [Negativicutes bacterium]|jgi:integrase